MRFAAFLVGVLAALGSIGGLDWWVDPFGDRYQPGILTAALAHRDPCFVSWEVVGETTWPEFKLDLARRRGARVVVVGTSRVAKIGAWPGERGFANLGVPGTGPESLRPLFMELHRRLRSPLTVYIGTDAFWFGNRWRTRASFGHSDISRLKNLLSGETFSLTLKTLWRAPGVIRHPQALRQWEVDQSPLGCVVDRGNSVARGASNAWGPDGTLYFQYEMTKHPSPTKGTLVALYHQFYVGGKMDAGHLHALVDALALARRYGWTVVGFHAPIARAGVAELERDPRTAGLWHDFQARIGKVYASYGFRYLDLTDPASVPCADDAFSFHDEGHPDVPCGRAIRRRLDRAAGLQAMRG
jgi:hypothetical protein